MSVSQAARPGARPPASHPAGPDRGWHRHHLRAVAHRVRRHLDAARAWATRSRRSASTTTSAKSAALATEWKPHIAFNLLEGFDDITIFDQNVVSHLELLKLSYTGCNPRGLLLARDKSLSKKLLAYHRIPVPEFEVFRIGRPIRRPKRLPFPLIVKSLTQEASIGISQASVVDSDEKLKERVAFIHDSIGTAAIVEQYIEGRELYVGILGNQTLQALPVWELFFTNMPEGAKRIATDRVKWSVKYQKKYGIDSGPARDLPEAKAEADPARLQARLPGARAERLRADRSAAGRGGQCLGARGEPQPADRARRGLRRVGREDRARLRGGAPAHHQPRVALAAGERGVNRRRQFTVVLCRSGAVELIGRPARAPWAAGTPSGGARCARRGS